MSAHDVETLLGALLVIGSVAGMVLGLALAIRDGGDER